MVLVDRICGSAHQPGRHHGAALSGRKPGCSDRTAVMASASTLVRRVDTSVHASVRRWRGDTRLTHGTIDDFRKGFWGAARSRARALQQGLDSAHAGTLWATVYRTASTSRRHGSGRMRRAWSGFWRHFFPRPSFSSGCPARRDLDDFVFALNHVQRTSSAWMRTSHLQPHIVLRFELERALISGSSP